MKKIILIGGGIGVGKSTLSKRIEEKFNYKRISFAYTLKKLSKELLEILTPSDKIQDYHFYGTQEQKESKFKLPIDPLAMLKIGSSIRGFVENSLISQISLGKYDLKDITDKIFEFIEGEEYITPRCIMKFLGAEIIRDMLDVDFHVKKVINHIENSNCSNFIIDDYRFPNEYRLLEKLFTITSVVIRNKNTVYNSKHQSENQKLPYDIKFELESGQYLSNRYDNIIVNFSNK